MMLQAAKNHNKSIWLASYFAFVLSPEPEDAHKLSFLRMQDAQHLCIIALHAEKNMIVGEKSCNFPECTSRKAQTPLQKPDIKILLQTLALARTSGHCLC